MRLKTSYDLFTSIGAGLPARARHIYERAFNHAYMVYKNQHKHRDEIYREEYAHQVALSTLKTKFEKNHHSGSWREKDNKPSRIRRFSEEY
ncbi:MAG: ChaB [Burkholderiales bacterium]|jgi:cation transport regulator ChaB|nr:ChaB [Burkholderiales bacterium]